MSESEWDKTCKEFRGWLKYVPEIMLSDWRKVEAEGNKMQRDIATGYCGECDVHKQTICELSDTLFKETQKLETIQKEVKLYLSVRPEERSDLVLVKAILEVLGVERI